MIKKSLGGTAVIFIAHFNLVAATLDTFRKLSFLLFYRLKLQYLLISLFLLYFSPPEKPGFPKSPKNENSIIIGNISYQLTAVLCTSKPVGSNG